MFYMREVKTDQISGVISDLQRKPSRYFEVLFVTPKLIVNGVVQTYLFGYNFVDRAPHEW